MRLNYLTVVTKLEITEALCTTFSPQSPEPLTLHPVPQLRVQVHQVSGPRMWKCLIPCHKHQLGKSLHNKGLESRECVSSSGMLKERYLWKLFLLRLIREIFYCSLWRKREWGSNRASHETQVSLSACSLKQLLMGKTHLIRCVLWVGLVHWTRAWRRAQRPKTSHTFWHWCSDPHLHNNYISWLHSSCLAIPKLACYSCFRTRTKK